VFLHREIEGKIKTCTIKRDGSGRWYVIFVTEREDPVKVAIQTAIGVDLGITHAVATSDGDVFDYPRYYVQSQKKLRSADKTLRKLGSKNRKKAAIKVAQISSWVVNLRDEFLHQVSRKLVDSADAIIFEDLSIGNMLKNYHLAKHISDVSWGKLVQFTHSKASRAGKCVVLVDPRNTSQRCSGCGQIVPKDLSERVHSCPKCGLELDRDHNAALNILTLGLRGIACGEWPSGLGISPSKRPFVEAGSLTP
jgi:putative transposase